MARVWSHFFVMLWVMVILSSGIYIFSRGFLLSRRVRTDFNECIKLKPCDSDSSEDPNCLSRNKVEDIFTNVNSSSDYCLPKKTRIIFIVIDALKFDFGVFDKNKVNASAYENKMPIFNEMLTKYPNNTRFMKLIADAPTTTLQRLKGITTGSLPTFIDVGSNFGTDEIIEDNIIDQVKRNNLSAVFLGDSTWTDLYPKRFIRQYSYPSFDIFDLDTVDLAINKALPNELKKDDWSLLVAHYLGVDHCGHKFGPLHSEMARKLTEMNAAVEKIIEQMDDETTLFVIGDHGMTVTGDHGGDTQDEVNSMIFTYSKKYTYLTENGNDTMDQIDLPPTISAILGVPIPFSNLGATNFDIVPDVPIPNLNKQQTQILHTWQNTKQMHLYFHSYLDNNEDDIPAHLLENYLSQFHIFSLRIAALYRDDAMDSFCQDANEYLKGIANDCRQIWAKFDANLISQGLLLTAVITFFLFLLTTNLKFTQFDLIFTPLNLSIIFVTNSSLIIGSPIVHYMFGWEYGIIDLLRYLGMYGVALLAFFLVQNWDFIAVNWSNHQHFCNFYARSVFIFAICVFFSNSYIIHEQKVLCYLLCGSLAVFLYKVRKEYNWLARVRKLRPEFIFHSSFFKLAAFTIVTILLLRSSYDLHRCREEHGDCSDFKQETGNMRSARHVPLKTSVDNIDMLPILTLAIFTACARLYLKKCGNLTGFAPHVVLARYASTVTAVACGIHFITTITNFSVKPLKGVQQTRIDSLAWIVYIIFLFQILIVIVRPLMLFILQKPNRTFNVSPFGCVVPQIVMKMKQMYDSIGNAEEETANDDIPVVYGLATVYSSILCSVCVGYTFVYAVLLGPVASNGIFVVVVAAILILVLNAIHRYQRCTRLAFCLQPEVIALVSWHLLSHYSFYATAHQPTLSQINWHAAFVGRTAFYDHNNIISAILILINTFGGHFLVAALFPMLVIAPNALYTIFPSLAPRRTTKMVIKNQNGTKQREIVKKITNNAENIGINVTTFAGLDSENEHLDISHGELALYENEDLFFGQLYKTGTQLVIMQAMRIFCSMIACTIHCRHLMVWKIFAPRFIFEAIATFVVFGAILIGFLIIIRIHKAVSHLISVMSDANQ